MPDSDHAVLIAGAGPTGMMLAAELAMANVDVAVVEQRPDRAFLRPGALGFHSRTIEILDQRGVADRFLARGTTAQVVTFGSLLDMSDFPTRHPYSLGIPQSETEQILADWIAELPVITHYGRRLTGFAQDENGVEARFEEGGALRADYLVGCDGGRSLVRKAAGIEFPGWEATRSNLIAHVKVTEEPPQGIRHDATGIHAFRRMEDGDTVTVVVTEQQVESGDEPTLDDLSEALRDVFGTDFGVHSPTWISRFTDTTRQAAAYRAGRVLLAGDAAHIHYPAGGQGLGLGMQDAMNLGWKLAQVVKGTSADSLLDTYHAERHPVGARALHFSMALGALQRRDGRMEALVEVISELAGMDEPRRRLAGLVSGLDIHYDLGDGHPLLGRRMPDLDLTTGEGEHRVFELLHEARPVLLNLARPGRFDVAPWGDRLRLVDARYDGTWELPVLGAVSGPTGVLIRPDGHVAWVDEDGEGSGLADAVTKWFGPVQADRPSA